jgi:hypothetical protein
VGTSLIKGYQLLFKGSKTGSYLTIEKSKDKAVPVAVWKVTESDERSLDRYEGFPDFYYKQTMELDVKGIRTGKTYRKKAFVYIMHEERELGVPFNQYVRVCLEGYQSFGFSAKYLEDALKISLEVANGNSN